MTHTQKSLTYAVTTGLIAVAFVLALIPTATHASTYAYVDAQGNVKSITANDWMTAIAIAPNIHINSGVMILLTALDFTVIGDQVVGAK